MQEVWKDIVGYENVYQVSTLGRVRSCGRRVFSGVGANYKTHKVNSKILSPSGRKYLGVILCKDGKTKRFNIHRLVAEAFIPNPDNLPCVNHKDENSFNNCAENLEWCSYKYNNEYNGRIEKCRQKISDTLKIYNSTIEHLPMSLEQRKRISDGVKRNWQKRKSAIINRKEIKND